MTWEIVLTIGFFSGMMVFTEPGIYDYLRKKKYVKRSKSKKHTSEFY
jgi:hypothetical protein